MASRNGTDRERPYFDDPEGRVLAFAHRGGALLWPENTLTAFRNAIDLGYRHLETDVHLTRDGELVVIHDSTLERTTNGRGPIAEHSLAELRGLDAGHWFAPEREYPHRGKGERIPILDELFALDPDVRFNVEIKPDRPAAERALWRAIERLGVHDRVLVASANHEVIVRFRALSRGRVATSASQREVVRFWAAAHVPLARGRSATLPYDALQIPIRWRGIPVLTAGLVRSAHARGLHVHVWTIDDPVMMRRLIDLRVDGIMTDRPDLLKPIVSAANTEESQ